MSTPPPLVSRSSARGPAGFCAADRLMLSGADIEVVPLDRLPTPRPCPGRRSHDHPKIEAVTRVYERLAASLDSTSTGLSMMESATCWLSPRPVAKRGDPHAPVTYHNLRQISRAPPSVYRMPPRSSYSTASRHAPVGGTVEHPIPASPQHQYTSRRAARPDEASR
jgi:hypothetical protein